VAAGLALIHDGCDEATIPPDLENLAGELRAALARFDREQLLDLLVQRAVWDESLTEELLLLARSKK
jgi:hypothetical protein